MLKQNKLKILLVFFVVLATFTSITLAYTGTVTKATINIIKPFLKSKKALSNEEVIRLSKLSNKTNGTVKVGNELAKRQLSNAELEDVYIRIAIHQNKIPRSEAEQMFVNLNNVPGFRTTLRKSS